MPLVGCPIPRRPAQRRCRLTYRQYTAEQLRRIADDYTAGYSYQEIERRNDCSSATVARAAKLHNVASRYGKAVSRPATTERKVRTAQRRLASVVPTRAGGAPGWTWFDYVEVTGREFATPLHLRQGPVIKAWLEAHKVKP